MSTAYTPLAGVERFRPPVTLRVAIGEIVTRGGKTFPTRRDYFTITRASTEDARRYVVDQQAQDILRATCGDKPQRVPIQLVANNPAVFLRQNRAWYMGDRCICQCGAFRAKDENEARRQNLYWPPPDNPGEEYYVGIAERRKYAQEETQKGGTRQILKSREAGICDPRFCPYATGELALFQGDGAGRRMLEKLRPEARAVCKRKTVFVFHLDLPDLAHAGGVAKFTSTGYYTAVALRSSLKQIAMHTGGLLLGLPCDLVYSETPPVDTPLGRFPQPQVFVESRVPAGQLPAYAAEISAQLAGTHARLLQLAPAAQAALADEEQPHAIQRFTAEFSPQTAEEDEVIEAEVEAVPEEQDWRALITELGRAAGKSAAAIRADLAECVSPDDYLNLQEAYQQAQQAQQTIDSEEEGQPARLDRLDLGGLSEDA